MIAAFNKAASAAASNVSNMVQNVQEGFEKMTGAASAGGKKSRTTRHGTIVKEMEEREPPFTKSRRAAACGRAQLRALKREHLGACSVRLNWYRSLDAA